MPRRHPPNSDEKPQFERFIEAAKQIEAAETDDGLTDIVRKVAETKHKASRPHRTGKRASS